MSDKTYEVIIIGAGMAGITASIYASRKKMDFLLLSKDTGGQLSVSGMIENYPGFKQIDSPELTKNLKEQMEHNNISVTDAAVSGIDKEGKIAVVHTDWGDYRAESVIIATGSKPRKLGIPGEEKFARKGLSYCAICDGPLFSGRKVAVVGGGNSALEAIEFLERIASKIYVLNIGEKLTGHEVLVEKAGRNEKVELINNARATEVFGDKFVSGIGYEKDGGTKQLDVEGIFVQIGRLPNTGFVRGFVELDSHNHIKVSARGETSVKCIYAAGDVTDIHEYQYCIAAGQGCIALLSAAKKLHEN